MSEKEKYRLEFTAVPQSPVDDLPYEELYEAI